MIILLKLKIDIELVKKWHPDVFSNDTKENQEISKRNMQKLNNAYNIIKKHKGIK